MAQDIGFCPVAAVDVLPGVLGLLPPGVAWIAASIPGTNQNNFWTSIATLTGEIISDLCSFRNELFCSTAVAGLEQWAAEYQTSFPAGAWADPKLLCTRVTLQGGATCADITRIMADAGYVVTACVSPAATLNRTLPIVGCITAGCMTLGPRPVLAAVSCNYGRAVSHPTPSLWPHGTSAVGAACGVPGSTLGTAKCCLLAGYFSVGATVAPIVASVADACVPQTKFTYALPSGSASTALGGCSPTDSTGHFQRYTGYSFLAGVQVGAAASAALHTSMGLALIANAVTAQALIEQIKPAHISVSFSYV